MSDPDAQPPPVAVILVNWNAWRHTIECLDSLLGQGYPDFQVFIADNDSQDDSVERIAAWCSDPVAVPEWRAHEGVIRWTDAQAGTSIACRVVERSSAMSPPPHSASGVTLIRSGGNLGFAGGCNVGLRAALSGEFGFFWLLNSDTVVHRDALAELVRRAQCERAIGMVGSTLRFYDAPQTVEALGGARVEPATGYSRLIGASSDVTAVPRDAAALEQEMVYVTGASMLVSKQFVQDVGLLQEDYFLYFEEIDWAMRGRERFRLAYAPCSHVFHKSGASSKKVMPLFSARFYYGNRIRFFSRFFPKWLGAVKRGLAMDFVRHTLRGRWGMAGVVASTLWNAKRLAAQVPVSVERIRTS